MSRFGKSAIPAIPHDAWTKALHAVEAQASNPDAMTVMDLSRLWACSRNTAQHRVTRLVAANMAKPTVRETMDTMGRRRRWPAYVLWTEPGRRRKVRET